MNKIMQSKTAYFLLGMIFFLTVKLSAQTADSALGYFPIHIGDVWEYHYYYLSVEPYDSSRVEIIGDTLADGFTYMIFKERILSGLVGVYWKRLDSLSGSVYMRIPPDTTETQEDSLRAGAGEYFQSDEWGARWYSDIQTVTLFGNPMSEKTCSGYVYSPIYHLVYGIGLSYWYLDDGVSIGSYTHILAYAKVNGVLYGTPLGVPEAEAVPSRYFLRQNYPNPFNPGTRIEYYVPKRSFVKLSIFNVIGQKISEWSYPDREAGWYIMDWNPRLPSGIYFCRLDAVGNMQPSEHFTQTRKMMLMK